MSLEIINYNTTNVSESELLTIIKQRTGLELEVLNSDSSDKKFSMRFPDMETAQNIGLASLNRNGTFFIDADNHFLCYSTASGTEDASYIDDLYRAPVVDFNGKLGNICYSTRQSWGSINTGGSYVEDDSSKSNITLCPLRAYAYNSYNGANNVRGFVKNCYVNYERKFQKGLKFIDQNGNRFVTLGGYLLYKIN